jgi:hypothetical protein
MDQHFLRASRTLRQIKKSAESRRPHENPYDEGTGIEANVSEETTATASTPSHGDARDGMGIVFLQSHPEANPDDAMLLPISKPQQPKVSHTYDDGDIPRTNPMPYANPHSIQRKPSPLDSTEHFDPAREAKSTATKRLIDIRSAIDLGERKVGDASAIANDASEPNAANNSQLRQSFSTTASSSTRISSIPRGVSASPIAR